jgi:SsrA-binding protein
MSDEPRMVIARNRKARHDFEFMEEVEAGVVLVGPEVKSIRDAKVSFQDAFARVERGEVYMYGVHISPYVQANRANVDPDRARKLLLHKTEIRKLKSQIEEKGLTLVPLEIYFVRGKAKIKLGLGRGRKNYDKREKLKRQTQEREAQRAIGGRE